MRSTTHSLAWEGDVDVELPVFHFISRGLGGDRGKQWGTGSVGAVFNTSVFFFF